MLIVISSALNLVYSTIENQSPSSRIGTKEKATTHLQQTRLRVLPTSSEQPRRLDTKVTHLLLPSVEQTSLVRFLEYIPRSFDEFLLRGGGVLPSKSFGVEVLEDGSEVAFGESFDLRSVELCSLSVMSLRMQRRRG